MPAAISAKVGAWRKMGTLYKMSTGGVVCPLHEVGTWRVVGRTDKPPWIVVGPVNAMHTARIVGDMRTAGRMSRGVFAVEQWQQAIAAS